MLRDPKLYFAALAFTLVFINGFMRHSFNLPSRIDDLKLIPLIVIISTLILAPIIEELVFRKFIYKLLQRNIEYTVFSCVAFLAAHIVIREILSTPGYYSWLFFMALMSFGLCQLFLVFKNIWLCVLVHFAYNFVFIFSDQSIDRFV